MIKLLLLGLILFLVTIIPLYIFNSSSPWPSFRTLKTINFGKTTCTIFQGRWIWYPNRSYYTNATCQEIFDQHSCIKFGRPDTDFLKWRWKPDQCELPLFDANQSMAFVGDSLARNQMQSLLCLLATVSAWLVRLQESISTESFSLLSFSLLQQVVYPLDVSYTSDSRLKRWFYVNYNFTLASFWSPHLVKAIDTDTNGPTYNRLMNLYLDEANDVWAAQIEAFDYVIISAGRWFYGPQVFFENGKVVGCHLCLKNNIKNLTMLYGYRRVFRTAFKILTGLENFNGVTFLRTLSPAHFENGKWNRGGNCIRTRPVSRGEMKLEGDDLELYLTQVEELRRAEREGKKRGLKFRLLDINEAMVVRPDGHPNHYGHWPHENVTISDCVHWCLPGPIDTWNDFLLQMLKMERY